VTVQSPFQAETPLAVIHMQLLGTALPLPNTVRKDLPEQAEQVMLKALAREPADRYPSCGALAKAFAAAIQGVPAATVKAEAGTPTIKAESTAASAAMGDAPTTRLSAPPPVAKRSLPLVWIGGAAVVGVIALIAVLSGQAPAGVSATATPEATAAVVVVPSETATIEASATTAPTLTTTPSPSPTASRTPSPSATATEAKPTTATEWTRRGEELVGASDYEAAIAAYEAALELEPEDVTALVGRGTGGRERL